MTLKPNRENLDLFWRFVNNRQEVWYRKEILKQPYPYIDDPILSKYRFCNIYRRNDTGTKYVLNSIITDDRKRIPSELFFNLIIYRIFNRIATYEHLGYQRLENFNYRMIEERLTQYKKAGGTIFTSAFMITGAFYPHIRSKHGKYCKALNLIYMDAERLYERCRGAKTMQECHHHLNACLGIGDFLAYQIMLDAMYAKILPFDEDMWTVAGVGSRRGLSYIFGEITEAEELEAFRWLRDNQRSEFSRLGLDFKFLDGQDISLSNVQSCCCEFSKYYKALKGIGRPRVLYRPKG